MRKSGFAINFAVVADIIESHLALASNPTFQSEKVPISRSLVCIHLARFDHSAKQGRYHLHRQSALGQLRFVMVKVVHLTVEGIKARMSELEQQLPELKAGGPDLKHKRLRVLRQLVQLRKALEDPHLRKDPEEEHEKAQKDTQRRVEKKLNAAKTQTPTTLRCLGCKRKGHLLKDCRKNKSQEICYKCGSTQHSSRDCLVESEDYPFAVCFNCKKTGHLASACSTKSTQGIYIRGGSCYKCGSVWHLAKNCTAVQSVPARPLPK